MNKGGGYIKKEEESRKKMGGEKENWREAVGPTGALLANLLHRFQ